MSQSKPKGLLKVLLPVILIVVVIAIAITGWNTLFRRAPLTYYESPADHFKYGSVGTEAVEGIPYWIWVVLPRLFPEKLPGSGGYTSLGLTWEEGREMPIGLTKERIGFDRVGVNCALCHVGTVRSDNLDKPSFLVGGPSTKFDVQRYLQFFFDCAHDPRFTATFILPEIEYNHHITLLENILYRLFIIPQTQQRLLAQEQAFAWMNQRPPTGPGRTDINPFKIRVLGLEDDGTVGSADIMPLWNKGEQTGFVQHWDGLNTSLREAIVAGALGTGTTPKELNLDSLDRIESWIQTAPPPPYPFAIDETLANQGQAIFTTECASCHASGGDRTGQVIPLTEVLTDPNRANHWTAEAAAAFNAYAERDDWDFDEFQDTDGYKAGSLEGLWARAPYLHNGSVPSLASLLTPPEDRPPVFYRGYDRYDSETVGFVSEGPDAEAVGFKVDTTVVGNGNQGHLYGTALSDSEKRSLLEYLKTL
jgi:hypothetical protein